MARKTSRTANPVLKLDGFTDMLERIQELGGDIDKAADMVFEKAANNLVVELESKARQAGLPEDLIGSNFENWSEHGSPNNWHAEVGWKKPSHIKYGEELHDTYKVIFYNYGTPKRHTKKGGQRVLIDGEWKTLGTNRGEEKPHPEGSHGFIKKAKLAAFRKNKKLYEDTIAEVIKGKK